MVGSLAIPAKALAQAAVLWQAFLMGSAVPVVGEIFDPQDYNPKFTQPGGPGTAVFPAQQTGELVGMWFSGCGHSFNAWMVDCVAVAGVPTAVIMCPVCRFCQRLITPFSSIYDPANEIIMA